MRKTFSPQPGNEEETLKYLKAVMKRFIDKHYDLATQNSMFMILLDNKRSNADKTKATEVLTWVDKVLKQYQKQKDDIIAGIKPGISFENLKKDKPKIKFEDFFKGVN